MATETQRGSVTMPTEPSQILFESRIVQVGRFRCPTRHPRFADSGPTRAYCFVFPRTAVWIQHEGREAFVADSTVVPLYNPGLPYRRRQISSAGDRTDWFGVAPTVLREMLARYDSRAADARHRLFQFDFARAPARTFLAQRHIFERVCQDAVPDELYVEESVLSVLDDVLTNMYGRPSEPTRVPQHRALAEDAREVLNRTFEKGESLTALAATVGSSAFHLCRVFRRHTGQTVHGYRSQLRLRKSLELLGDTGGDILDVALRLGYSGHSHFTDAFHRAFGTTPSSFRTLAKDERADVARLLDCR